MGQTEGQTGDVVTIYPAKTITPTSYRSGQGRFMESNNLQERGDGFLSVCHAGSQTTPRVRPTDWRDRHVPKTPLFTLPVLHKHFLTDTQSVGAVSNPTVNPGDLNLVDVSLMCVCSVAYKKKKIIIILT